MDVISSNDRAKQTVSIWKTGLLVVGGLLICLILIPPMLSAEAAPALAPQGDLQSSILGVNIPPTENPSNSLMQVIPTDTETPTATVTETPTATNTETATATHTSTPTQTDTPTITPTPTQTLTQTITHTSTITPTVTQTRTPTATGTITPSPSLSVIARPTQARPGEVIVFTIAVRNTGTAPMHDVFILSSTFPTTINLESVTVTPASHGIVTMLNRSFSVALGDVFPGDVIDIAVNTRVNSTLTVTTNNSYQVSMPYDTTRSLSASANYKLVPSTLPGTGDLPLNWRRDAIWEGLKGRWLWGGLGFGTALLGVWTRKRKRLAGWLGFVTVIFLIVGIAGGCSASPDGTAADDPNTPFLTPILPEPTRVPYQPASAYSTPEAGPILSLPDFPIPTPVLSITPAADEAIPDTSPVVRIVIPALLLDTVVKYVPFDGFTWLIGGLRGEVAWMGNTSWPGLGSNTALAGHVTVAGYGDGPFRYLDEVPVGEVIILYTERNIYTYQVRETLITTADDMSVTYPTENPQVTLITCVDWDDETESYLNRLIVYADLVRIEPVIRGSAP
jgi:LPXTG-site transpeptidase (sortase) family protein